MWNEYVKILREMECVDDDEREMRRGIGENPGRKKMERGGGRVKKVVFRGERKWGEKG